MTFNRPTQFYTADVETTTPYHKARQEWDERIGSARVQSRNWRTIAFGIFSICVVLTGLVVWLSSSSRVTPYVIEVTETGRIRSVAPAVKHYVPTDEQIKFHLSNTIRYLREVSSDPVVLRRNWEAAFEYVIDDARAKLVNHARTHDPFERVGKVTVSVEIENIVRASRASFQLRWSEKTFEKGVLKKTDYYTGLMSIVTQRPSDEATLIKNPLGIYIREFNWSEDLKVRGTK